MVVVVESSFSFVVASFFVGYNNMLLSVLSLLVYIFFSYSPSCF